MDRRNNSIIPSKKTIAYLLLTVLFFAAWAASAADIMVVPSIGIAGAYNDNIYFSQTREVNDYTFTASPGIFANYRSGLLDFQTEIGFDIVRYLDETNQNTINQRYTGEAVYRAQEQLSFNGNISYIKDSTLDSELEETGVLNRLSNRHRFDVGGGLTYNINPVSDIDIDYSHREITYDLNEYTDHTRDSVSLAYNYTINDRADVFSITPTYEKLDSDISETDIYGLSIGISHAFTNTLHSLFHIGTSYSDTWHTGRSSYTGWGWTADASLEKSWTTASASVHYMRDINYTSEGEPAERNRFSVRGDKILSNRVSIGITGSYYFTESLDETRYDMDERFFNITPSIYYKITENHSLELSYEYSYAEDRNLPGDNEAVRNIVWVTFNFAFPQKW
ncbi:MAG TPA: hypothetical protein PKZ42_01235 [Syntrophales bacterium]|nr:hypothetical protein [Syntrophales bacterium]